MTSSKYLITVLAILFSSLNAFTSPPKRTSIRLRPSQTVKLYNQIPKEIQNTLDDSPVQLDISLTASTAVGIPETELPPVLDAIASVCREFGIPFHHDNIHINPLPLRPKGIPGILGRVILIHVIGVRDANVDDTDLISQIKVYASEEIDNVLNGEEQGQPILLGFRNEGSSDTVEDVVLKEIEDYGLRDGMCDFSTGDSMFMPCKHIQIDGAYVDTIDSPGITHFDTSSVVVFDNLLSSDLRRRLLNVVKGIPEDGLDEWDDGEFGPNPERWERGGLADVVDEESDKVSDGTCWGLTTDAIQDICFNNHPAIVEFESILSQLFSEFIVSRLPEAVFGDCISPLTANAPTHGDSFNYHIDADPLQVPLSPWADVFGRYPNRSRGKPRFVSCLLYLNDDWEAEWGAPTRFLDPPTQEVVDVVPKPGRCVIMDQDISHTVVAPDSKAGKRPRYSLVWKLILHPKRLNQDMTDLSCSEEMPWPKPSIIGSANS